MTQYTNDFGKTVARSPTAVVELDGSEQQNTLITYRGSNTYHPITIAMLAVCRMARISYDNLV